MTLNGQAPHASGGPFRTGVIDPPWPYKKVTTTGNNLSGYVEYIHADETRTEYRTLTIADLRSLPVGELISGYAFLWCPNPFLPAGLGLLEAWGFQYATAIHWRKTTKLGKVTYGAGFWYRGAVETILVAKKPGVKSIRTHQRNVFDALRPPGHSTKPEEFQDHIEEHFPGPYVELFARRVRPGWTCLGDECPGDMQDIRVSLPEVLKPKPIARVIKRRRTTQTAV